MIYITGDTHGEYDAFLNRIYQYPVSKDDIVIFCGDFGFVWDISSLLSCQIDGGTIHHSIYRRKS